MSTTVPESSSPPQLPPQPPAPAVSDKQLALVVYILYFVSYVICITVLIGVIIAHVQVGQADALLRTHYQWQIRTFWIGLLYLVIGILLTFIVIGIPVLIFWFVWTLVRSIKGVLALNENRPIANPTSWLFG
jgi:uncharacterized membrane protein